MTPDETIILQLSSGPKFINYSTPNYWKIRKLLPNTTETELQNLLITPEYSNGVFKLYKIDNTLIYWGI